MMRIRAPDRYCVCVGYAPEERHRSRDKREARSIYEVIEVTTQACITVLIRLLHRIGEHAVPGLSICHWLL